MMGATMSGEEQSRTKALRISAFLHQPPVFSQRSGMYPLAEALGAEIKYYEDTYKRVMRHSWRLGHALRKWGNSYYGSSWNALLPYWGEWLLARTMPNACEVAHFLWGEFAGPRHPRWFRKKAKLLVGTFHASARKLPSVLAGTRTLASYDAITLMSETQIPFFSDRGVSPSRMRVILHGVDTTYFQPVHRPAREDRTPLTALLVGSTERDHGFMAEVLKALPPDIVNMTILTAKEQRDYHYRGVPHTSFPERLSDQALLEAYQQADVLIMPMLDCTANNAVLEAMACGTPVLCNRIGGIAEYVGGPGNYVLDQKNVTEWVDCLVHLAEEREELEKRRSAVRAWGEQFAWRVKAQEYIRFYQECLTGREDQ